MTTKLRKMVQCALCDKKSKQEVILSTNSSNWPDLDTRPSEMERSTIKYQIQTCPSCGYCAPSISDFAGEVSTQVNCDAYQRQLNNPKFTKSANAYLCYSILKENAGEYAPAGWACLQAAWICDDENSKIGAKACRKKAVVLLQKGKEAGQKFATEAEYKEAIMVDLLRRSSQFQSALEKCEDGLNNNESEIRTLKILSFQKELISKLDVGCHSISEVPIEDTISDNERVFFDKKIFERIESIARLKHVSKIETKRLLIEQGIKSYIEHKFKSGPMIVEDERGILLFDKNSVDVEMVAYIEKKKGGNYTFPDRGRYKKLYLSTQREH
jgi:hypothetical protein